jgi:hypothetical protein
MSMLEHIQQFAMHIAEDGHGYGRHVGDLTMRLPERQWMALVAEVFERAKYAPLTVATPRSMYEPLTIATSYGFNVVVEGPERPLGSLAAPPECVVTKVDHETRTVEMYKVGSTDVCMRRNCIDARAEGLADCVCKPDDKAFFFRAPTPEELAANEKFAAEFMGRVIPGITCQLPPEDSQGVGCRQCGEVNCTKNHAEFM